jgi:cytochrome c heme-lyase
MGEASLESTCPVSKDSKSIPASLEEAARYAQTPQPDQTIPLAFDRQVSSIPRGTGSISDDNSVKVPDHQLIHDDDNKNEKKWVYPSEQQMYNAMRKKGWTNVPEESIPVVLKIHNHINESTWNQILDWENVNTSSSPSSSSSSQLQLVRFQGRPNDMSPKAYIFSKLLRLYDPPFDRHDWYVQKSNHSRIQRYVIDYYYLPTTNPNMPPIPYIDARPALDHPYALYLHARRFVQLAFPGIMAFLRKNER